MRLLFSTRARARERERERERNLLLENEKESCWFTFRSPQGWRLVLLRGLQRKRCLCFCSHSALAFKKRSADGARLRRGAGRSRRGRRQRRGRGGGSGRRSDAGGEAPAPPHSPRGRSPSLSLLRSAIEAEHLPDELLQRTHLPLRGVELSGEPRAVRGCELELPQQQRDRRRVAFVVFVVFALGPSRPFVVFFRLFSGRCFRRGRSSGSRSRSC